ncbi:Tyrosine-type recombinase/integrase [Sulfidibacter corallicola]
MNEYREACQPLDWLFYRPDTPHLHLSPKTLVKRFAKLKERAGLIREGGLHSFRHSFATHLIARGIDIYTVQKLLGHKSVTTTQVYIHLAQSMILSRAQSLDLLDYQSFKGVETPKRSQP